jgi:hypothetical protein
MNKAKNAVFEIQKQMYEDKEFFGKTATNPFYNSKYVPLNSILRCITPKLHDKGCMLHHESSPAGPGMAVVSSVVTHIESGDEFSVPATIPMEKLNPQEGGKAVTYGRRYSTGPQFGIPEYDDDGEGAMKREPKTPKPVKEPKAIEKPWDYVAGKAGVTVKVAKEKMGVVGVKTNDQLINFGSDAAIKVIKGEE